MLVCANEGDVGLEDSLEEEGAPFNSVGEYDMDGDMEEPIEEGVEAPEWKLASTGDADGMPTRPQG